MCNIFQPENALSINEQKDAFYSLKTNKRRHKFQYYKTEFWYFEQTFTLYL